MQIEALIEGVSVEVTRVGRPAYRGIIRTAKYRSGVYLVEDESGGTEWVLLSSIALVDFVQTNPQEPPKTLEESKQPTGKKPRKV
jgi:hypothetical protein